MKYDYAAMDDYYEDMLRASKDMQGQIETLMTAAHKLLVDSQGGFAKGYEEKADSIRDMFEFLNTEMQNKARTLQDMFIDMGNMDQKLGDGF